MERPFLKIENLKKVYPAPREREPLVVFEGVNFGVQKGEFACIIGHSGCGKTTILNILAGLDQASSGVVLMNGREIAGPSLDRGVVFQSHALLPWLTARRNVDVAARSHWPGWSSRHIRQHCEKYLDMVGLSNTADKKPAELSGGMKQRVGIARAFVTEPKMLLLDEPFGALDALTRGTIQDELMRICIATRQTVFMITHDVDEAILLADKILLMTNGPRAHVAEVVENTLPRNRSRQTVHKEPRYYPIRNYLMDFLLSRSQALRDTRASDGREPPIKRPGLDPAPAMDSEREPLRRLEAP